MVDKNPIRNASRRVFLKTVPLTTPNLTIKPKINSKTFLFDTILKRKKKKKLQRADLENIIIFKFRYSDFQFCNYNQNLNFKLRHLTMDDI